jgi:hypothetical protein
LGNFGWSADLACWQFLSDASRKTRVDGRTCYWSNNTARRHRRPRVGPNPDAFFGFALPIPGAIRLLELFHLDASFSLHIGITPALILDVLAARRARCHHQDNDDHGRHPLADVAGRAAEGRLR